MSNRINFKKIKFKNIQTYGNYWTEVDFEKSNSVLITGKNGAGKSTIINALTFNLYGKPYTKVKKEEIVNRINGKGLLTELIFEIDKDNFKIIRGIKPNKFEIYKNDELINQSSTVREYQIMLEQTILKMTELAFRQIVILGSADYVPFMKMGKSDKRKIGEEMFNIQLFSVMNKLGKERLSIFKRELADLESSRDVVISKIDAIKMSNSKIAENNDSIIQEIEEENRNAHQLSKNLITSKKEYEDKLPDVTSLKEKRAKISKNVLKIGNYKTTFTAKINDCKDSIRFYHNNDNCPTCSQNIDNDFKTTKVENENKNIEKYEEGVNVANTKITELEKEIEQLDIEIDNALDLMEKISDCNTALRAHKNTIVSNLAKIERLKQGTNDSVIDYSSDEAKLQNILKEIKEKETEIENAETAINLLKDDGVKAKIITSYLPVFNSIIAKYLKLLDYNIQFSIDSQFNDVIKVGREIVPYLANSEGQKKRLDLAMLFTMREFASVKNGAMTNLLILDEVMDSSLDEDGLYAFSQIMESVIQDNTTIMVISHREGLSESFQDHIKVKLKRGFSRIE